VGYSSSYLCSGGSLMACFGSSCENAIITPPGMHLETAYGSGFLSGPKSCEENPHWGLKHLLDYLIPDAEFVCRCPQGKCNIITISNCWDIILEINQHAAHDFDSYVPPFGPSSHPVSSEPSVSPVTSSPTTSEPTRRPSFEPSNFPTSSIPTGKPHVSAPTFQPTTTTPTNRPTRVPTSSRPTRFPTTETPTRKPFTSRPTNRPTTKNPTRLPTTLFPTRRPTSTTKPTIFPTEDPTILPTTEHPTNMPTSNEPTNLPLTTEPTREPTTTAILTSFPSEIPSFSPITTEPTSPPVILTGICENPTWAVVSESECPELEDRMVMRNCQDPETMALGQLCEADGSIAGFPQANTINNCGNEDIFRLISCEPIGIPDESSCLNDQSGLYTASYGLIGHCDRKLSCDTILSTSQGTTVADYCVEMCGGCNCASGSTFVNADLEHPEMVNGEIITLMCPSGFLGNVQIQCDHGNIIVSYGTCVLDLWSRSNPRDTPTMQPVTTSQIVASDILTPSSLPTTPQVVSVVGQN